MIHIVWGKELAEQPELADAMFRERRKLFREKLGWSLKVDEHGRERDEYDDMNPLYIIITDEDGDHLASTRILPTTGRTMIADHFSHLTDGVSISSGLIWEVTRFFVSGNGGRQVAATLMWAGCALAYAAGVEYYVGVIDRKMAPVFAIAGAKPEVIGSGEGSEGPILACLWRTDERQLAKLAARVGDAAIRNALSIPRLGAVGRVKHAGKARPLHAGSQREAAFA